MSSDASQQLLVTVKDSHRQFGTKNGPKYELDIQKMTYLGQVR